MTHYVEFQTISGDTILVEVGETPNQIKVVAEEEASFPDGVVDAGLADEVTKKARAAVSKTQEVIKTQATLEGTVMRTVRRNAEAFIEMMNDLSSRPDEAEIAFGLKAMLNADVAVVKAGSEATYTVKLTWKRQVSGSEAKSHQK